MRTVITIEARMRSTRLPGKVLCPVLGRPMLALMVERLRRVQEAEAIVIATTSDPSCDPIEALAKELGVGCFRGSEDDVLDRVLQAARAAKADLIVETTGDCPLIDPDIISRLIREFRANTVDYCANILKPTYPRGMDAQVFPVAVLEEVARLTDDPVDHEHVSLYIYQHPERFRLLNVESGLPAKSAELRLTVDTPEDYQLITEIYEALYPTNPRFALADVLDLFERRPELRSINADIRQKAVR
ncbi:MAG: glycosyltransferase family protein [Chthoniobacter sp.]|nr:glycosyltransferase family protein [Chthoniobacter sp.]